MRVELLGTEPRHAGVSRRGAIGDLVLLLPLRRRRAHAVEHVAEVVDAEVLDGQAMVFHEVGEVGVGVAGAGRDATERRGQHERPGTKHVPAAVGARAGDVYVACVCSDDLALARGEQHAVGEDVDVPGIEGLRLVLLVHGERGPDDAHGEGLGPAQVVRGSVSGVGVYMALVGVNDNHGRHDVGHDGAVVLEDVASVDAGVAQVEEKVPQGEFQASFGDGHHGVDANETGQVVLGEGASEACQLFEGPFQRRRGEDGVDGVDGMQCTTGARVILSAGQRVSHL
mmetsp:Transcript_12280/g.34890  ORF Transcript_12280/g.34890 Transcript_12280/m.34890 type:complete len:284 (+) Transcript_12280:307-1158(+)